ncbi:hypothetical protein HDU67_006490 [Dinochytrium kinnereticum]|nr:hypothetical protein HDU67_006490 [Dinochytrium kinnereticum]
MPFPSNLDTAKEVEDIIRGQGSIPATIALLDGFVHVGLTSDDLRRLAESNQPGSMEIAVKASRRDLALVLSKKLMGATTVSGTMAIAQAAGIKVFVTGGIGGVHRGGESSMDISADLTELSRTPIAVVCAGVKSILDIGRTLEVLETHGVPVISYGTDEFPAFYLPKSGFKSIAQLNTPLECAQLIKSNDDLGLQNGVLVGVPIPEKEVAIDGETLDNAIVQALREADSSGIHGKDVTPFLLDKVKKLTSGGSLASNIALIKNNALVGSQIAKELAFIDSAPLKFNSYPLTCLESKLRPLIIGGTVMDITSKFSDSQPQLGTSHSGKVQTSLGGVARNMAEACFRTGGEPIFWSAVGSDAFGVAALEEMSGIGMDVSCIGTLDSSSTAIYSSLINGNGQLVGAVADMRIHEKIAAPPFLKHNGIVAFDGNLSLNTVADIYFRGIHINDIAKAVQLVTPNFDEVIAMGQALQNRNIGVRHEIDDIKPMIVNPPKICGEYPDLLDAAISLSVLFKYNIVKLGKDGVLLVEKMEDNVLSLTHINPDCVLINCESVTGAGDTLVGTLISYLSNVLHSGAGRVTSDDIHRGVIRGMKAAFETIMSPRAVSPKLSPLMINL